MSGVSRSWLKSPWDEIAYLVQKYVTCESRFSLVFLYHIRILQHLNQEKLIDIPYYLLQSLNKMSAQVKKNKNKERSMYHHGLIKMLEEYELNQKRKSWNIFLWEDGLILEIGKDSIESSPPMLHQEENILPPRRVTRAMDKAKLVQSKNEKAKEERVPNFQGLQRKSQESSKSSIGIDKNQKKFYDYINEREERDKNPIFEEIEDVENITYQQEYETSFGEDLVVAHENEQEDIPQAPAEKTSSPIQDQVEKSEQKSNKKIKKLKDKIKTFKVLEIFLKNENTLLKERNHTLISENENIKEAQEQLQEEHELVCHQAFLWNKSRKALKKQNRKLQVKVQICKIRAQPIRPRQLANVEVLLRAAETI